MTITIIEEKRTCTEEEKLKWWGDGEWVKEIDFLQFEYLGYKCEVKRIFTLEPYSKEVCVFGGHLCGYVYLPKDHKYYGKYYDDVEIDVHGGLTYSDDECIGFDCAHTMDLMPSMHGPNGSNKEFSDKAGEVFGSLFHDSLFNEVYKNIGFCVEECKQMVDQLIEVKE